jgi:hypothetical protein
MSEFNNHPRAEAMKSQGGRNEFHIPKQYVGSIIGKGGETMRGIERDCGGCNVFLRASNNL